MTKFFLTKFFVTKSCLFFLSNLFSFLSVFLFNYEGTLFIFLKSFYVYDLYTYFIFFLSGLFLTLFLLFLSFFISNSFFYSSKINDLKSYECGFDPIKNSGGVFKFNVQYFRIALIFLIFDLEILFLFPWVAVSKYFVISGYFYLLYSILPFFFFLVLSILYEFIFNLLNWQFRL